MRFKRLRKAVGTAIVLFILIIGIIMIVGLTKNPSSQSSESVIVQGRVNPTATQNVQASPSYQQPQQAAYHPMLMTGAS